MGKLSDCEVVLKKDKVYTSYFSKATKIVPDRRLVSIALTHPEGWKATYYRHLNPSINMLMARKNGEMSDAEFEETYRNEVLRHLDPNRVYQDLKGKVMCCWEKTGDFCHRHIVTAWLQENLGEEVVGGEI